MHASEIGAATADCAAHLHRGLGPGLLETVYEVTLARELDKRALAVQRQVRVPIEYDGHRFEDDCSRRILSASPRLRASVRPK
ncbi:MAG: GxxExxY protein [Planctomycetes bacterium]|nr:GxxExxY protein [Planctomycetota bacterium]